MTEVVTSCVDNKHIYWFVFSKDLIYLFSKTTGRGILFQLKARKPEKSSNMCIMSFIIHRE